MKQGATAVHNRMVPTVAYEQNDARPTSRPSQKTESSPFPKLTDMFLLVNQHSDGYVAMAIYDVGKYDATCIGLFMTEWMESWAFGPNHNMHKALGQSEGTNGSSSDPNIESMLSAAEHEATEAADGSARHRVDF
eukprot:4312474-Prymnesium_polylepis.1